MEAEHFIDCLAYSLDVDVYSFVIFLEIGHSLPFPIVYVVLLSAEFLDFNQKGEWDWFRLSDPRYEQLSLPHQVIRRIFIVRWE